MASTEPKDIREIQKQRRSAEHRYAWRLSEREYVEKVRAGLTLRLLGELVGAGPARPDLGEQDVKRALEGGKSRGVDGLVIALKAVETWGVAFRPDDIAQLERELSGGDPGAGRESSLNDSLWVRQGVDALLRGDVWGYLAPGRPSVAAELAWRHLSPFHEGSRLYAGMFVAACVSAAFVADDLLEAVYVGLGEVPDECRLSRAVAAALRIHRTSSGWIDAKDRFGSEASASNWDGPAVAVAQSALALLSGGGDLQRTWELLGETGDDDPSLNGAIGSLVGVQVGVAGLPPWMEELFRRRASSLIGGPRAIELDALGDRVLWATRQLPKQMTGTLGN